MTVGDSLLKRALRDSETGLSNSISLRLEMERAIERAERYEFPISMITVRCADLEGGALTDLGRQLGSAVRRSDCMARIGEREFRLLLTHDDAVQTERVIERLREICRATEASGPSRGEAGCQITIDSELQTSDFGRLLEGI